MKLQIKSFTDSAPVPLRDGAAVNRHRLVCDVLEGLRCSPRRLPTQYLYDARGSALFEQITRLPEYYPTRTEMEIFEAHLPQMADVIGENAWLIELGSGSGKKTTQLLAALRRPAGYTPIDISTAAMDACVSAVVAQLPQLKVAPLLADFARDVTLPCTHCTKRICFFPGSTIGNFGEADARALLRRVARWVGPGGGLLIGIDLVKSPDILIPAYDDAAGVTAQFNLNLLDRINREAEADFDPSAWTHRAVWNAVVERMESYLVSDRHQRVHIGGEVFEFPQGEAVWTEQSQKYTLNRLRDLAEYFEVHTHWQDERGWCAVVYLEAH